MEDIKLYLSENDKKIMGVCGGLAEYFEIDSTIIRLLFAFLGLFYFLGIIIYFLMGFIIPKKPIHEGED